MTMAGNYHFAPVSVPIDAMASFSAIKDESRLQEQLFGLFEGEG